MGQSIALRIKRVLKHPLSSFVILGIVLLLVNVFYRAGIIQDIAFVRSVARVIIYSIVAMGFSLLLGYAGLASVGTSGLIGLGAFLIQLTYSQKGIPMVISILICLVIALVVGALIGFISLRIEGMYLAIITLCLSTILVELFRIGWGTDTFNLPRFQTFFGKEFPGYSSDGGLLVRDVMYYILVPLFVIVAMLTSNLMRSPAGRAMLAMKDSDSAAKAMGISVLKYRLIAFIIATVYAVFAGCLYMFYFRSTTYTDWGLALSLNILAAVIVGGSKSLLGCILGCFIIFGIDGMFLQNIPFFQNNTNFIYIISGALIIIVVMFYPGGLAHLWLDLKILIRKLKLKWRHYKYGD